MAVWSSAYITALPDSAFACIDSDGRHYPHHDAGGKLDLPHLRAALSRVGDASNTQCGKGHLQKHADAQNVGKAMPFVAMKATPIDDDAFRLLAHPFGGPLPYAGAPKGADLDRQWYDEGTDFKLDWFPFRLVDWHHRTDPASKADILGKAVDPETDEDGQWVTVWLNHGKRRVDLVRRLAEAGAQIFGSSEAVPGLSRIETKAGDIVPWERGIPGRIAVWPYMRQALSTSPQNTHSVVRSLKGTLDDLAVTGDAPTAVFFDDLATFLDSLAPSPETGKAGRVLAARNEARLLEAREHIDEAYYDPKRRRAALTALSEVLAELDKYLHTDT